MQKREYLRGIVPDSQIYHFRPPPLEFPLSPGEIEDFPRDAWPKMREDLRKDFYFRRRFYREWVSQRGRNARRADRGTHTLILIPDTFEALHAQIVRGPGYKRIEAAGTLWEGYYLGKSWEETEWEVHPRTLTRYLQAAERALGILGEKREWPLVISWVSIRMSYAVLRMGRDANFDIQPYFTGRIF